MTNLNAYRPTSETYHAATMELMVDYASVGISHPKSLELARRIKRIVKAHGTTYDAVFDHYLNEARANVRG